MSEISELEGRLVAAMARIRTAVEANQAGQVPDPEAVAALEASVSVLEAERDAAQMAADGAQSALAAAESKLSELDAEVAALKATVANLETETAELRQAADDGADPANATLAADLAALKAARAEELRDVEALLARITSNAEGAPSA